jgi:PhnB protein
MKLVPYLNFNGNCRAAFEYYEKHLGGRRTMMMTHSEAPTGMDVRPDWGSAILHAHMTIGESELMASDVPPDRQKPMRSMYLHLSVSGAEEAERIFRALAQGGETFMPLQDTFWASRFGMLRDQFGTLWMISADRPAN